MTDYEPMTREQRLSRVTLREALAKKIARAAAAREAKAKRDTCAIEGCRCLKYPYRGCDRFVFYLALSNSMDHLRKLSLPQLRKIRRAGDVW